MSDALVLAGAAVKGAFTAGVLSVLSEPDVKARAGLEVARIVGASAGSLNGLYYAAAIHAGTEAIAGKRLVELWLEQATLRGSFDFSLRDIVGGIGLSTENKLVALLRREILPTQGVRPIELRLVITNADGQAAAVDGEIATTFEHVVRLDGTDFTTSESLERAFVATAASAALPGAYAPVVMKTEDGSFRGLDGGLVNDAPLGHALENAPGLDRVFVITPFPRIRTEPANLHGLALASHIFDILIEERLFRDLRRVAHVNRVLAELPRVVPDAGQRDAVMATLGWSGRRPVRVVEIRPEAELPGDSVSGFTSRALRERYVQLGVDACRAALAQMGS